MERMQAISKMRPFDVHQKVLLLREKSGVEFYVKENERFIGVNCPACNSKGEVSFYKYGFTHNRCNKCKTIYVSPRPKEKLLFKYYSEYEAPNYWTEVLIKTNHERKYLQHLPRVKKLKDILKQYHNTMNDFVEIGAGNGNFSKAVDEAKIFKNVLASDISKECLKACESQGLNTKEGTIKDFDKEAIDCIAFNDLIEHVFDPHEFIKECFNVLRNNGILMLSTPNGEGFDFKILKEKTENITPPEHIQYFNPLSIKIILERAGFEVLDISTPGILDVEIIKRQRESKKFDLKSDNNYLDYILSLDNNVLKDFQKFLQNNLLSSHMLVFAIKR